MSRFVELHALTSYPPSCLVRDDAGRPKTAVVGGIQRGRISSSSLKRALRTSEFFTTGALAEHRGKRTSRLGDEVLRTLTHEGLPAGAATAAAARVAAVFGKVGNAGTVRIAQLAFLDPGEIEAATAAARRIARAESVTDDDLSKLICADLSAVDIALFGRMFADRPENNSTGASCVMHPFTIHQVSVETDFYVAVDDWADPSEESGLG